ncbi:MAG: Na+/H+ antiporter subunit E [Candidatus Latescibacteria bacterium]|nr:Na+/H+ antiporter subunit E [Candidatus Latescibacterota bacterium]
MADPESTSDNKLRSILYMFLFLYLIWLCLSASLHYQELLAGIFFCLLLTIFLHRQYYSLGLPPLTIKRFVFFIIYLVVLFNEIVRANIDVAYRVIHPKMPIKPGIIVISTKLKQDIAKMILANSITLTPGTFTLDIIEDKFLVHWINVQTEDIEEATRIIGEKFEKYLRVIFE